jgi:glycosyltransferase involved in cell wall biosynthesis
VAAISEPQRDGGFANARILLGVGPLEAGKGFRDAVWAFDILRYLYDDLILVLIGAGSEQPNLVDFARAIGARPRVHFLGPLAEVGSWIDRAEIVWVPSLTRGGVNVTLEAMAIGRPVVATKVSGLSDVIVDGVTGFLVPPGDKTALARKTRTLLDDPSIRTRMSSAGKERALSLYDCDESVAHYSKAYSELAADH